MKKIGQGWQYNVYDLGNGRVRKIKRSILSQYIRILRQSSMRFLYAYKQQRKINIMKKESNNYIKSILSPANSYLFGNPFFINESDYDQDKVVPVITILKNKDNEKSKKILDDFTKSVHKVWEYGFSDCVFKFDKNNGIDEQGRIIQIDFGEFTTDKEKVKRMIQSQKWIRSTAYDRLSPELKEYYREIATTEFTLEKLNEHWATQK